MSSKQGFLQQGEQQSAAQQLGSAAQHDGSQQPLPQQSEAQQLGSAQHDGSQLSQQPRWHFRPPKSLSSKQGFLQHESQHVASPQQSEAQQLGSAQHDGSSQQPLSQQQLGSQASEQHAEPHPHPSLSSRPP
ncbi:hypothetical protein [Botrimarina mediterranea]|uniref:hypothetical protein n=1 Tax=Botrimarina mediterranea TaxID=2528022 RepID=UPI003AF324C6